MIKRISLIDIVLLLLIVIVASIWVYQLRQPPELVQQSIKPAVFKLTLPVPEPIKDATTFSAVTDRPLFWADRRKLDTTEEQQETAVTVAMGQPKGYHLIGIVKSPSVHIAIVQRRKEPVMRIKLKQKLEGWQLSLVEKKYVEFTRNQGADTFRMDLYVEKYNKPKPRKPVRKPLKRN